MFTVRRILLAILLLIVWFNAHWAVALAISYGFIMMEFDSFILAQVVKELQVRTQVNHPPRSSGRVKKTRTVRDEIGNSCSHVSVVRWCGTGSRTRTPITRPMSSQRTLLGGSGIGGQKVGR
jgi:hypothetical protein